MSLISYHPDVICLTETFLSSDIPDSHISLPNYNLFRCDRSNHGGGIITYTHFSLCSTALPFSTTFEYMWLRVSLRTSSLFICNVYRPPTDDDTIYDALLNDISNLSVSCNSPSFLVVGDFNCHHTDWLGFSSYTDRHGEAARTFCNTASLTQCVPFPTRISPNGSQSLLDLVLCDFPSNIKISRTAPIGTSDHCLLKCLITTTAKREAPTSRKVWLYDRANWDDLCSTLQTINWGTIFTDDLESSAIIFTNTLLDVMSHFIPSRIKRTYKNSKPWFNVACEEAIHYKNLAFSSWKANPTSENFKHFKRIRNCCISTLRQAHQTYIASIQARLSSSNLNRSWWHLVKNVSGFSSTSRVPSLICNNTVFDLNKDKANILNSTFASKCTVKNSPQYANTCPTSNPPSHASFTLSLKTVKDKLSSLDINTSTGPDGISAMVLKKCSHVLAKPLCHLFNLSLKTVKFPSLWKLAYVTPVHKKGNKSDPNNYRPISILSNVGKVFESLISDHLRSFLFSNNLISPYQFGFRPGLSTFDALLYMHHNWASSLDNHEEIRVVSLDFSNAFDSVSHHGLLVKLSALGIDAPLVTWFSSYLSGRIQQVVIGGDTSSPLQLMTGVPQGSVLGPTLFLIYINDLLDLIANKVCCFADDLTLFCSIPLGSRHRSANSLIVDLNTITCWAEKWNMALNLQKCKVLTISRSVTRHLHPPLVMNGVHLPEVDKLILLGVCFSSNFSWRHHITTVANRASKHLGFLLRTRKFIPPDSVPTLYKCFVRSVLEYCSPLWAGAPPTILQLLDAIQSRAIRLLGLDTSVLSTLGLHSLHHRRLVAGLCIFFKLAKGISHPTVAKLLTAPSAPSRTLRITVHGTYHRLVPKSRLQLHQSSFVPFFTRKWNSLPANLVTCNSLQSFKTAANRFLLSNIGNSVL